MFLRLLWCCLCVETVLSAEVYHCFFDEKENDRSSVVWSKENLPPFDELILSWNSFRPTAGACLHFSIALLVDGVWSSFVTYAEWEENSQRSFREKRAGEVWELDQDVLSVVGNRKAVGFRVAVTVDESAMLDGLWALHAATRDRSSWSDSSVALPERERILTLPQLSQMVLETPHKHRLCSPVSTTAVIRFFEKSTRLESLSFAEHVWDSTFDVYGNWVLNTAQAAAELGRQWQVWVERLDGALSLIESIDRQLPVVISVRGPLPGSASPYGQGHLMVVVGYDGISSEFLCMDPAFERGHLMPVRYSAEALVQAWERRGRVAYRFEKR